MVEYIIKRLGLYISPVNLLSKQNRTMRIIMSKPCGLKVRRYADRFIDSNKYLDSLPGDTLSEKLEQPNWKNNC